MNRRNFISGLGVLGVLPLSSFSSWSGKKESLKITDVEVWKVSGKSETPGIPYQAQITPLTVYEEYKVKPFPGNKAVPKESNEIHSYYLRIGTDKGVEGFYGAIDPESAYVVIQQLKPFLVGQDPMAAEILWDKMFRLDRHSRAGHFMMAISAVDNAIWDLRGKYFDVPVYQLLGGPSRDRVEVYASCLGYSVLPEDVKVRCLELRKQGFNYQKWFFANGLADGTGGLMKNVEMVKTLRETLGNDYEIMFDAFNGWDLDYALSWAKMAEEYRPYWIEEAVHSDKIDSFAELRQKTSIPVATGEHFYGRWEVSEYLKKGAIDYIQADPEWCGGVSELVKICTLGSVFDTRVVPHGHNIHAALHVVASQSPMTCPLCEYLLYWMPTKIFFEKYPLIPVNGHIELPKRPGFGIVLDDAKVDKKELASFC